MTAAGGELGSAVRWRRAGKIAALCVAMAAIVIVPFVVFGDVTARLAQDAPSDASSRHAAGLACMILLAADVVLPVPSTIVIALLGGIFGAFFGTLVAAAGLTLGCIIGYTLGRTLGHDFALRTMGGEDFAYLKDLYERYGVLLLAICRPVPVLAEASVIVAGVAGLAAGQVMAITTLANIGFAAVYAVLGSSADTGMGLLVAVVASVCLPLAAMIAERACKGRIRPP